MGQILLILHIMWAQYSLFLVFSVSFVLGGIKIPRDNCEWRNSVAGSMGNRCDGDQLVVGACGSGFNNDCPDSTFALVECCQLPDFYYGSCEVRSGSWGELLECARDDEVVMGRCSTGGGHTGNGDCPEGNVHGIYCCEIDFLEELE